MPREQGARSLTSWRGGAVKAGQDKGVPQLPTAGELSNLLGWYAGVDSIHGGPPCPKCFVSTGYGLCSKNWQNEFHPNEFWRNKLVHWKLALGMQVHEHRSRGTIKIVRVLSSSMPLFFVHNPDSTQTTAALSLPLTPEQNFAHPALVLTPTLSTEQPWRTDTTYLVI